MIHAIRRPGGHPAAGAQTLDSSFAGGPRSIQLAAWLALPAILLVAAGCGGGSEKTPKQSTTVAQSEQGSDEEKDVAPPPAKKERKLIKGISAPSPAAAPDAPAASTKDFRKWDADNLNSALLRKDVQFLDAVKSFGAGAPNDAKRAAELHALVKKVGQLKDDAAPEVPLPPGALAEADSESADTPAKPGVATPAATPAAATPKAPGFRFRLGADRGGK